MIEIKEVKVSVTYQGAPLVNGGYVHAESSDIACVYVDLESKRAEILATGSGDFPCVVIGANEETLNVSDKHDIKDATEIEFPEYEGFNVFSANIAKYTMAVCLVRNRN